MDNNNALLAQDILSHISLEELFDTSSAAAVFYCWTQLNLKMYFNADELSKTSTPMRISYKHSKSTRHARSTSSDTKLLTPVEGV